MRDYLITKFEDTLFFILFIPSNENKICLVIINVTIFQLFYKTYQSLINQCYAKILKLTFIIDRDICTCIQTYCNCKKYLIIVEFDNAADITHLLSLPGDIFYRDLQSFFSALPLRRPPRRCERALSFLYCL